MRTVNGDVPKTLGYFLCGMSLLWLTACSDGSDGDNSSADVQLESCVDSDSCVSNPPLSINTERPAQVYIPVDYNTATRYPLVVLLHGRGANGTLQALYMRLPERVDPRQFVLVTPDGTVSSTGARIWNVNEFCCATTPEEALIDDVGYIRSLIEEAAATYSVDTNNISLVGHSNGGFLALRMVCEASDYIASVVSLAGATTNDPADCVPALNPVSTLLMHGDEDDTVFFDGIPGIYPSAEDAATRFATLAGCSQTPQSSPNINVDASIDGPETKVTEYGSCDGNRAVTLWHMVGSPHIPGPWEDSGLDMMVDWLIEQPRQ
ncbi:MAG: alpha/beta hydrolase-fold protein [Pseudomonadota bacterium]